MTSDGREIYPEIRFDGAGDVLTVYKRDGAWHPDKLRIDSTDRTIGEVVPDLSTNLGFVHALRWAHHGMRQGLWRETVQWRNQTEIREMLAAMTAAWLNHSVVEGQRYDLAVLLAAINDEQGE